MYLILKLLGSSWAIIHMGHSELVTISMYKDIKKKYPLSDYMIVRNLSGEIQQEIYSATSAGNVERATKSEPGWGNF